MKILKNNSGFTLVEIIVSVVILGIIVVSIIPINSGSNVQVLRSGNRSKAMYTAQTGAETLLDGGSYTDANIIDMHSPNPKLKITFGTTEIYIPGKIAEIKTLIPASSQKTNLKVFLSDLSN